MLRTINISTSKQVELIDITRKIEKVIADSGVEEGIATIFIPHTTAGITINENADPDVVNDIVNEVNKIVPFDDNYHHFEGNSAAHIKSSFFGASETIIIDNAKLLLGRWQGIYLCEFDGGRNRKVYINLSKSSY